MAKVRKLGPSPSTSHPPQPDGPPPRGKGVIGNLRYYRNFATDPFGFVGQRFARYGDIYRAINPDGSSLYVLRRPDHIREVLATRSAAYEKKHSAFEQLSMVLGDGLLTSDGEQWKRQRRLVQPAFHPDRLRSYAAAMVEETQRSLEQWYGGETRDMAAEMMTLTMRIVARTLFSHRVDDDSERVGRAMMELQRSFSSPARFLPEWLPLPARKRAEQAIAELDSIIYGLIGDRRQLIARLRAEHGDSAELPDDLLQALIAAVDHEGDELDGDGLNFRSFDTPSGDSHGESSKVRSVPLPFFSESELRDQLMTLFLAGHETTSNALTWTLYLLSQNPEPYRALEAEVDSVLAGRPATYDDLEQLPMTDQVVREAMRLYPPVTALARRARTATQIGPYEVPAGSEVIIWIYFTHRDPTIYPEPDAFRPERFADEPALPKMAYLPFGGGPRLCIGHAFALIEARLLLATMTQRFRFELADNARVVPQPRITLTAKHGMPMVSSRRQPPV